MLGSAEHGRSLRSPIVTTAVRDPKTNDAACPPAQGPFDKRLQPLKVSSNAEVTSYAGYDLYARE